MPEKYNHIPLTVNEASHHFELTIEGNTAFIEYGQSPESVTLYHTEVPEALRGKGAGTAIIEKTLNYIDQHHLKLVPLCPFVLSFLKKHPEWNILL